MYRRRRRACGSDDSEEHAPRTLGYSSMSLYSTSMSLVLYNRGARASDARLQQTTHTTIYVSSYYYMCVLILQEEEESSGSDDEDDAPRTLQQKAEAAQAKKRKAKSGEAFSYWCVGPSATSV
jgi:hypothetical protein